MQLKSTILLVIWSTGLCWANPERTVSVLSESDNRPVEGVVAKVLDLDQGTTSYEISNYRGEFTVEPTYPLLVSISHVGYETYQDTIRESGSTVYLKESKELLDEVVVTGQYQPQSVKNSVYKVKTISSKTINEIGANDLEDVLAFELNTQFSRDNATGVSGIQMMGLTGEYTKILIDGIPVSGRTGVTNEIDLNQIDVQSLERVEVIEGPMSAVYGADALAGVINLITKKGAAKKLDINLSLLEETVGKEYSYFDRGIHSPSLAVSYNVTDHWYVQANGRINRFGGWTDSSEGRVREWYPKTQYFGGFLTGYQSDRFDIYYRLDYLDQKLENFREPIEPPNREPYARDEEYLTDRWMHQLQSNWLIGQDINMSSAVSYTDYERLSEEFERNLVTNRRTTVEGVEFGKVFYRTLFTRQTFQATVNSWLQGQLGADLNHDVAGGTRLSAGDKEMTEVGLFGSLEFLIWRFKIKPVIRWNHNSIFEASPAPSINFKYTLSPTTQLRWSYGRGYRAPSIRELYHEFIDSNHNIIGNPDLKAETSHSFNADISHESALIPVTWNLAGFYNTISDQIGFFVPTAANEATSYTNFLAFKTTGGSVSGQLDRGQLRCKLGYSYIGRYQRLSELEDVPPFVFSSELNARLTYSFEPWALKASAFYKYTGANKVYQLDRETEEPVLNTIEGYHLLQASLSKSLPIGVSIMVGAKNLLDVTTVNSTQSGGAHNTGGQRPISYGRSYFLRINYHLSK